MITPSPQVSVIITAFRRADFVNQAIESVLRQTFTDYEIIVVDDGSGQDVISQYQLPEKARLIARASNSGRASIPRNDGFRASRGKYVAFLDMDDIWLPEKLASQVEYLEAHPEIGVTICHAMFVDESLCPLPHQHPSPPSIEKDVLLQMLARPFIHSPSQVLIRRTALETEGAFDEEIIGTSDWDLWLRLARSVRFHADPTLHALYRRHPGQQSRYRRLVCLRGWIKVLNKTGQWLPKYRPDLQPLLRRKLARLYHSYARRQIAAGGSVPAIALTIRAAYANNPYAPRTCLECARLAYYAVWRWMVRMRYQRQNAARVLSKDGESVLR